MNQGSWHTVFSVTNEDDARANYWHDYTNRDMDTWRYKNQTPKFFKVPERKCSNRTAIPLTPFTHNFLVFFHVMLFLCLQFIVITDARYLATGDITLQFRLYWCVCVYSEMPNLLKPSGFFTYHQVEHSKILQGARFAFRILYGYQNKQRLFPYTSLTDWLLQPRWKEFPARYGLIPYIKQITFRL